MFDKQNIKQFSFLVGKQIEIKENTRMKITRTKGDAHAKKLHYENEIKTCFLVFECWCCRTVCRRQ